MLRLCAQAAITSLSMLITSSQFLKAHWFAFPNDLESAMHHLTGSWLVAVVGISAGMINILPQTRSRWITMKASNGGES